MAYLNPIWSVAASPSLLFRHRGTGPTAGSLQAQEITLDGAPGSPFDSSPAAAARSPQDAGIHRLRLVMCFARFRSPSASHDSFNLRHGWYILPGHLSQHNYALMIFCQHDGVVRLPTMITTSNREGQWIQ